MCQICLRFIVREWLKLLILYVALSLTRYFEVLFEYMPWKTNFNFVYQIWHMYWSKYERKAPGLK